MREEASKMSITVDTHISKFSLGLAAVDAVKAVTCGMVHLVSSQWSELAAAPCLQVVRHADRLF
jgi:hypothetical protein